MFPVYSVVVSKRWSQLASDKLQFSNRATTVLGDYPYSLEIFTIDHRALCYCRNICFFFKQFTADFFGKKTYMSAILRKINVPLPCAILYSKANITVLFYSQMQVL